MYADENVIKIKHDVLYEVAKLAFAGELEEKKDYIANQLIPGPAKTVPLAASIKSERLSDRESDWQKEKLLDQ